MYYELLDPLGKVRRKPHWCSHFRVDRYYDEIGSDVGNLHRGGELYGERRIAWRSEVKRSENGARTETEFISDQQHGRSTGVHKQGLVDRPVNRCAQMCT